uniref:HU family DNA-binding protein n=1 Tax=Niveibacterium sp. SC-1 TaxID=3135646 RepID=UPI0040546879
MLRSELIDRLQALNPEVPPVDVELAVKSVLEAIAATLASGDRLEIRGFGNFSTRQVGARAGRNPRTGDGVPIPPRRAVVFKPGLGLKGFGSPNTDRPVL